MRALEPPLRPPGPRCAARLSEAGGSGGGNAETEAFPVGERSEAPQEAPRERLQCSPSRSRTCLSRPDPAPGSGLRAPAPHPGPGYCLSLPQGPTRSAILRAPSPTRTACRRAAGRAGPAGRGQRAVGGTRGASVGCWEEGTPHPPPSQGRPRLLFSPPGTSYRCFSDELRPASGLDRTVPLR